MDVRICERLVNRQEGAWWMNYHDLGFTDTAPMPINPGTHERRTTLASHWENPWNIAVWVVIGGNEYGFMEYPNNGSMTEQELS